MTSPDLRDALAVAPHAIAGNIGANVEIGAERRQMRIADFADADQRTGFRIGLAEAQEIVGVGGRQDDEIALHETRRDARRRAGHQPPPAGEPRGEAVVERRVEKAAD